MSTPIPTQSQYEENERRMLHQQLRQLDEAPLADRKAGAAEFLGVMQTDPQLVAERLDWIFQGNYGYGAMRKAQEILAMRRSNRPAMLTQLVGALEWQSTQRDTNASWNRLTPAQKRTLDDTINAVIRENETRENPTDEIRPGDLVTIQSPRGQYHTGRVVMRSSHPNSWVLNMGGRHGTPGIATEGENIVRVRKGRSRGFNRIQKNPDSEVPQVSPATRKTSLRMLERRRAMLTETTTPMNNTELGVWEPGHRFDHLPDAYPRRKDRDVVKNPGESQKVWICHTGEVLKIPADKTWTSALPDDLAKSRYSSVLANSAGWWRGMLLNERLYIHKDSRYGPSASTLAKLKKYAAKNGLSRGVVVERV